MAEEFVSFYKRPVGCPLVFQGKYHLNGNQLTPKQFQKKLGIYLSWVRIHKHGRPNIPPFSRPQYLALLYSVTSGFLLPVSSSKNLFKIFKTVISSGPKPLNPFSQQARPPDRRILFGWGVLLVGRLSYQRLVSGEEQIVHFNILETQAMNRTIEALVLLVPPISLSI